jgi:hypothetical protein
MIEPPYPLANSRDTLPHASSNKLDMLQIRILSECDRAASAYGHMRCFRPPGE